MTLTVACQKKIASMFAPIDADPTGIVRRDTRSLDREGMLKGAIEEAARRGFTVLRVGRHLVFFNRCRLAWVRHPQPVEMI